MKSSAWTMPIPLPAALSRFISLPVSSTKEIRAILPALFCGFALGIFILAARQDWIVGFVFLVYPIACAAIGAIAFGHDYTSRTLASFLALPIPRSRIFWMRLRLCFFAMLPLAVLVIASLYWQTSWMKSANPPFAEFPWHQLLAHAARSSLVPILSGLFLAPWLTLMSRSPLFGTTLAVVIPIVIGFIIQRVRGYDNPNPPWPELSFIPMLFLSVTCGFLGWRKFQNLEVIDGEVGAFSRSTTRATAAAPKIKRNNATLQLITKDLMLLRMPVGLAIAGMFLIVFLNKDQAALWTLIYPAMIFLLICAVASADERQLGVAEWQMLVPVAFYKQWMIKFFVTWSTALVVGLALPVMALFYKTGEWEKIGGSDFVEVVPVLIAASFGFVALTLYVSSLCNSGLKALIAAILVNVSAAYVMIQSFDAYSTLLWTNGIVGSREILELLPDGSRVQRTMAVPLEKGDWWNYCQFAPFVIAIFGFACLALILAMRNHRYAERGTGRILRQLIAFAGYEAAAALAIVTFWNWYTWLR